MNETLQSIIHLGTAAAGAVLAAYAIKKAALWFFFIQETRGLTKEEKKEYKQLEKISELIQKQRYKNGPKNLETMRNLYGDKNERNSHQ